MQTTTAIDSANVAADLSSGTDFADLDALLAESVQIKRDQLAVKEARRTLSGPNASGMSPAERDSLKHTVLSWELQREWLPVAAVAAFDVQECKHCGSSSYHFNGIFQRQRHRTSKVDRWLRADDAMNHGLPREPKYYPEEVPLCSNCAPFAGYVAVQS